jgi:hypothetical protein
MTCNFRYKTDKGWEETEVSGKDEETCIAQFEHDYEYKWYSYMPLIT